MTKFVAVVMVVALTVVFSASALADGWKIGNWEPPTKAPVLKTVSLNADWGTPAVQVAPAMTVGEAGCSGLVRVEYVQQACSNGRLGGGRWFLGRRIMANRRARASARMGNALVRMGSGH